MHGGCWLLVTRHLCTHTYTRSAPRSPSGRPIPAGVRLKSEHTQTPARTAPDAAVTAVTAVPVGLVTTGADAFLLTSSNLLRTRRRAVPTIWARSRPCRECDQCGVSPALGGPRGAGTRPRALHNNRRGPAHRVRTAQQLPTLRAATARAEVLIYTALESHANLADQLGQ